MIVAPSADGRVEQMMDAYLRTSRNIWNRFALYAGHVPRARLLDMHELEVQITVALWEKNERQPPLRSPGRAFVARESNGNRLTERCSLSRIQETHPYTSRRPQGCLRSLDKAIQELSPPCHYLVATILRIFPNLRSPIMRNACSSSRWFFSITALSPELVKLCIAPTACVRHRQQCNYASRNPE